MRKIVVVGALVFATGVGGVRARAGGLQIPYLAPKQGQIATVINEESTDGTLSLGGKRSPITSKLSETYTQEIVAVKGDVVTKEKIIVTAAHNTVDAMGQKSDADLPVKGKTYVVASDDGVKTTVTGSDGKDVIGAEHDLVVKLAEHVGTPDKLGQMLGAKTFTKGTKVALTEDELAAMMGKTEGMTASDVSLTLTAQNAKVATFEMVGTLSGKQTGMDITVSFKGVMKVDIKSSLPIDFTMTGTMKGTGDAGGQKLALDGKIAAHHAATYK
jgi:hypothetical protein